MNVTLSKEAAASLESLVEAGTYPDIETALEAGIQALLDSDPAYLAELQELLDEGARSSEREGGRRAGPELVEHVQREGRKLRSARSPQ